MVESTRKLGRESMELRGCFDYALEMDFREQVDARLVFMAFFGGQTFRKRENTTLHPTKTPHKNTHLSEVRPLLLAISVSLLSEELR
jgi:hypothetical protein